VATKKNKFTAKRSKGVNKKPSRQTGKGKVLSRVQKRTKKKSAHFYFRSKKPSTINFTQRVVSAVLSMDLSAGKKREIVDGTQVLPFIKKIRSKLTRKNAFREAVYAIIDFHMDSGKENKRTIMFSKDHPDMAKENNTGLVKAIDDALKEGASRTKTFNKAFLISVKVKRFYYGQIK